MYMWQYIFCWIIFNICIFISGEFMNKSFSLLSLYWIVLLVLFPLIFEFTSFDLLVVFIMSIRKKRIISIKTIVVKFWY